MNSVACLNSFKAWLSQKKYSLSTIKNYLADLNKYFDFNPDLDHLSSTTLNLYLNFISVDSNQNRYTSSLAKFFQFALDQKIIDINHFKKSDFTSADEVIKLYQNHLVKNKFNPTSIKNYLADTQQFIDWLIQNPS